MKPSKFFRKYNRTLILVFMSLLLVAFLLMDVIQSWGRAARNIDEEVGTAFGEPISTNDLRFVSQQSQIAARFGLIFGRSDPLDSYLLLEEARRMGIRVGSAEVEATLTRMGVSGQLLRDVGDTFSCSRDYLYEVIGSWMAVQRVQIMLASSVEASLPRLELAYRDQTQQAVVRMSVIDSNAFLTAVSDPSEEELAAYFEEAKDREDGSTEDGLVYGYRRPDRVQLEYLSVDPEAIRTKVRVRAAGTRRYYEMNRSKYVKRIPRPTEPTTQPFPPQFDEVQQSYEEVAERVKEDWRAAKAVEEAQRLVNKMRAEANEAWVRAEVGEDGYRNPPAGDLTGLFEALRAGHSGTYDVIFEKTDVLDRVGVRALPGFGRASYRINDNQRLSAADFALQIKGLYELTQDEQDERTLALNVFEPSPVLTDFDLRTRQPTGPSYFFRVVKVDPAGPAESIDAVRDKLVEDMTVLKAHAMAEVHARKLFERARQVGLDKAVAESDVLKTLLRQAEVLDAASEEPPRQPTNYLKPLGPFTPRDFSRSRAFVFHEGVVLFTPKLPEAVFALADEPTTATSPAHKVGLVQIANSQKWVVVELIELEPVYAGDFEKQRPTLARRLAFQDQRALVLGWFDPDLLRQRTGFVSSRKAQEAEQP
ncbi:MAG: hypothetical protein IH986_15845 [Planctomycetes bacterium]|nr:hypothetical protein [Planctomycetota bacterium]